MKNLEHTIKDVVNNIQLDEFKRTSKKSISALDAASLVPGPVGMAASAEIARRALAKGDYLGAALAAPGIIPGLGRATSALRVGSKVARYFGKGKAKDIANKALKRAQQKAKTAPAKTPKTKPAPATPAAPPPNRRRKPGERLPGERPAPYRPDKTPAPSRPDKTPAPSRPDKTPAPSRPDKTPRIEPKPEAGKAPRTGGGRSGKPTRNLRRRLPWWMLGLPSLTPAIGGGGGVGQIEPSLVKLYHASPAAPLNAETEIKEPLIEARKVSKGTEARRKVEGVRRFKNKKPITTLSKNNSRTFYEKEAIKNTLDI